MLNIEKLLSWVIIVESSLVCIGNVVTVLVFWKQRVLLKRACYLLLNLAFADSLVGATELIHAAIHERAFSGSSLGILGALFASVSLLSLVVIALERAYAVLWPLRHRVASARNYIISIVMVWIGAVCLTMTPLTLLHLAGKGGRLPSYLLANKVILMSLCLIMVAYLAIRKRVRSTNHTFEAHYRKSFKQNVNLSRTLFLAVGLSIGLWFPATAIYTVIAFHHKQPLSDNNILIFVGTVLYLGNSLVNPIVYSCRMPMFKAAVKEVLKHEVRHSNSN